MQRAFIKFQRLLASTLLKYCASEVVVGLGFIGVERQRSAIAALRFLQRATLT